MNSLPTGSTQSRMIVATVTARSSSDGMVAVNVGSAAVGQGLETVMAQIAADTLGIPLARVRVLQGSTSYLQEARSTISLCISSIPAERSTGDVFVVLGNSGALSGDRVTHGAGLSPGTKVRRRDGDTR